MKRIMTMLFALLIGAGSVPAQQQKTQEKKKRIGVLPFKNKGGNKYTWLSEGFATTMTEGLSQIQSIYVVDRGQINSIIKKGKFSNDSLFTSGGAYEIGKQLGLDYVLIGAFAIDKQNNLDAIVIVANAKKKGEYVKACLQNSIKPMASLWTVYDEMISAVCKTECFNVKISEDELKKIKEITANTENSSAYEYYIKGRKEHLKYSVKGYEDAIGWYDKALQVDPNYALAFGAKGEAQAFWGYQKELNGEEYKYMYDDAQKNVQKALSISSDIGSLHRNMATTFQMLRKFDDAHAEAQKAVDLNQNDAEAWYQLWRSKYGGKVDDPEINRALEISPYLPVINLTLGNEYMNEKVYDKAEDCYKRALTGNDEYELAWANLGNLYVSMKRYDDAIAALNRAIELKPKYSYAIGTLGYTYEQQGFALQDAGDQTGANAKFQSSLAQYKTAAEINPKDAWTLNAVGWGYMNLTMWQEAYDAFQLTLRVDPQNEDALKQTEKIKAKLGK